MRLYVQGLPSCRVLSVLLEQRLGRPVGRFTLNRWVDRLGGRAKTPLEVSAELRPPGWSGFLGVDGKAIYIAGEEAALVVAVDQGTHDVVHAVVADVEGEDAFERLVREAVTGASYPLKGLVSDARLRSWRPTRTTSPACRCSSAGSTPPAGSTSSSPRPSARRTPHSGPS